MEDDLNVCLPPTLGPRTIDKKKKIYSTTLTYHKQCVFKNDNGQKG